MKKSSKGPAQAPGMAATKGGVATTFAPTFGKRSGMKRGAKARGGRRR